MVQKRLDQTTGFGSKRPVQILLLIINIILLLYYYYHINIQVMHNVADCPQSCRCIVNCDGKVTCPGKPCPGSCQCMFNTYKIDDYCVMPMPDPCLPPCVHKGSKYRVNNALRRLFVQQSMTGVLVPALFISAQSLLRSRMLTLVRHIRQSILSRFCQFFFAKLELVVQKQLLSIDLPHKFHLYSGSGFHTKKGSLKQTCIFNFQVKSKVSESRCQKCFCLHTPYTFSEVSVQCFQVCSTTCPKVNDLCFLKCFYSGNPL